MRTRRLLAGLVVLVVVAAVFTVGRDDSGEPADTRTGDVSAPREISVTSYVAAVRQIEKGRQRPIGAVVDALRHTYQSREEFLAVFRDALGGEGVSRAVQVASALEPPAAMTDVHRRWVESLRASFEFETPARVAIAQGDGARLAVAVAEFSAGFLSFVAGVPPEVCAAVAPELLPSFEALCRPGDPVPGGEYGARLRSAARVMPAEVGPRISGLQRGFTDEEILAYLGAVQPAVERLLGEAVATIDALDPPLGLRADHDLVLEYFRGILAIARQVTAAVDAADLDRLDALFAESGAPAAALGERLSAEGRAIVGALLLDA